MSFNLRDLKKEVTQKSERLFKRHLVWGEDLFALETYRTLRARHGVNEVALIGLPSDKDWNLAPFGPSRVRGEKALEVCQKFFPEHKFELDEHESQFFKEGSFRTFSSRSKSEELLWGEEFFIEPKIKGIDALMPNLSNDELNELRGEMITMEIKTIEKMQPVELIENTKWCLVGLNGVRFECESLYIAQSPARFLELYGAKKELSDEMVAWCEGHQTKSELGLRLVLNGDCTLAKGTLFLPLSYTHPWGHFIGEFIFDSETNQTRGEFIHFLDKFETSEEEITKKIRLFKRQLEKINPEILKNLKDEYVFLKEKTACLKFDKQDSQALLENHENLKFVSVDAPLEVESSENHSFEDSFVAVAGELRAALVQKNL
jgi:hypothetical protein